MCVCEQPVIKIGDVLLISEDNVSRGKWPMERVERLVPGKDGLVRIVTLKTQKGRLRRPVQRLHRLEASTTQFVSDKFGDSGPSSGETPLKKWRRRWRIKQAMRKPVSSLQQYWRSWGNVRARNRSSRSSRPPVLWGVINMCFSLAKKLSSEVCKICSRWNIKVIAVAIKRRSCVGVRTEYSRTSPQRPPCGQRKVAVVERWPLRGGRGVIR